MKYYHYKVVYRSEIEKYSPWNLTFVNPKSSRILARGSRAHQQQVSNIPVDILREYITLVALAHEIKSTNRSYYLRLQHYSVGCAFKRFLS